jgi:hypothetical protein
MPTGFIYVSIYISLPHVAATLLWSQFAVRHKFQFVLEPVRRGKQVEYGMHSNKLLLVLIRERTTRPDDSDDLSFSS